MIFLLWPVLAMVGFPNILGLRICPAHEHYVACIRDHCRPTTCSDLGKNLNCSTVASNEPCDGGCVCNDFFVRNDTGKCVFENTCPTPQCPENEKYEMCAAGHCSPEHCSDIEQPQVCAQIEGYCPGGCFCKRGYLRHQRVCIPQETCPNACPEPHSHFTGCKQYCNATTCAGLRYPRHPGCVPLQPGDEYCDIGCACDDGFLWERGRCVRREQCDEEVELA